MFFTEGGGGRPGDTDGTGSTGLDCLAFMFFAELSGLVPLVGVNAGYCFAGNAALLGCCDVVIATEDSNIGMGGPAMIEGGGLGVYEPTDDRSDRRCSGPTASSTSSSPTRPRPWSSPSSTSRTSRVVRMTGRAPIRHVCATSCPIDRLRSYDVREAIDLLFDTGSVLELRRDFGVGMITALARIEGRPVGVIANNPRHLAGAIDAPGRTRRRGSCSSATPSTSRSSRCATRQG